MSSEDQLRAARELIRLRLPGVAGQQFVWCNVPIEEFTKEEIIQILNIQYKDMREQFEYEHNQHMAWASTAFEAAKRIPR